MCSPLVIAGFAVVVVLQLAVLVRLGRRRGEKEIAEDLRAQIAAGEERARRAEGKIAELGTLVLAMAETVAEARAHLADLVAAAIAAVERGGARRAAPHPPTRTPSPPAAAPADQSAAPAAPGADGDRPTFQVINHVDAPAMRRAAVELAAYGNEALAARLEAVPFEALAVKEALLYIAAELGTQRAPEQRARLERAHQVLLDTKTARQLAAQASPSSARAPRPASRAAPVDGAADATARPSILPDAPGKRGPS
jgi:hypothetical protein